MPAFYQRSGRQPIANEIKPRIRRLTVIIASVLFVAFSIVSTFVILRAQQERHAGTEKLIAASHGLSQALDREVASSHALLVGLGSSPALHADDLRLFHKQLTETSLPEGAWLVLSNKEKVLLHSLYPFGTKLPSLSDFAPQPAFLERIDTLEFSLTGRVRAVMLNATMVTINMKVSDPDGGWRYFLTTVLSDQRFASFLKQQRNPPNFEGAIYDQNNNGIVSASGEDVVVAQQMAEPVRVALLATPTPGAVTGIVYADDPHGVPSLIAFNRSEVTQWTATMSMPQASFDGQLFGTLRFLAVMAGALMLAGGCALFYLRHLIEAPIGLLETSITEAGETVEMLTGRLLQAQEDEHQRIARELHDSTAQHLVAALLGMMSMEKKVSSDKTAVRIVSDVKSSIELALTEMRTFSYLLHPRDLGKRGLATTLTSFVHGFIQRSGIRGEVSIDPAADDLSIELQRSLLRIGQEALANVHRHAKATSISVTFRIEPERIVLTITDNGLGSGAPGFVERDAGYGVGIPSMKGRLNPFGGALEIESSTDGTTVRAIIPRTKAATD
ncbi:histidine kinase [Phyllobacterium sp. CCNWLW109]